MYDLSAFPQWMSSIGLFSSTKTCRNFIVWKFLPSKCKTYWKDSAETQFCFRSRQDQAEMSLKSVHLWSMLQFQWILWGAIKISVGNILTQCPCRLPVFRFHVYFSGLNNMLRVRAGCTHVATLLLALMCLLPTFQAHGRDIACGATGFDTSSSYHT